MAAYIKLFTDYDETFDEMSDAEAGRLIKAVLHYGASGETRTLSGGERLVFGIIRRQIDRDNESAVAHREAGLLGGRPKTKQNQTEPNETKQNQTEPNRAMTKEEDKDKEKEKDISAAARARDESHSYQHTGIGDLVSANLKAMSGKSWEDLRAFMAEMPEELIRWAILDSVDHGGNTWAYVRKVLCSLQEAGITTVAEAEKRSESYRQAKRGGGRIAQTDYEQRAYEDRKPGELPAFIREMMEEEQEAAAQ